MEEGVRTMAQPVGLLEPLCGRPWFRALETALAGGEGGGAPLRAGGLVGASPSLVLALLASRTGRVVLCVVPDDLAVDRYRRDLGAVAPIAGLDPAKIGVFPALEGRPYDALAPHPDVLRERLRTLDRLASGKLAVVVSPARALLTWLPSAEELASHVRVVRPGDRLSPERFLLDALAAGYRRVDTVGAPGEVSRRGGIVDLFPPAADEPVRIELFGDTVESLRTFDTDHQRSTRRLEQARIGPAVENPPTDEAVRRLTAFLERNLRRGGEPLRSVRHHRERLEQLRHRGYVPGFESLAAITAARAVTLFEHVPDAALLVDEPERVREELRRAWEEIRQSYEESEDRVLPPPEKLFVTPERLEAQLGQAAVEWVEIVDGTVAPQARARTRAAPSFAGRLGELASVLREAVAAGQRVLCVMRTAGSAQRLAEILEAYGLTPARAGSAADLPTTFPGGGGIVVVPGALRAGFEFPEEGLTVLSEREVFGEPARAVERRARSHAAFVSDFRDLKPGDLVVHVDHGIARYAGLGRPKGGSLNRDFMVLEFAGGDRLFVPVDRLDLVQKYSGVAGQRPVLDRLGSPSWERVKARVRRSVHEMAQELLELYARRKAVRGHAFAPDTPWQRELEAAFPYPLTPDQERALAEIKADMESERPMDRLLVGDVGFGKTELAVRAAFKAVMDGFQVALLAPTTVLAYQHYETFRERYAPFPVRVAMVSRLRSAAEIRRVLEQVQTGEIDVLVGTHRLLSRDVRFRRLGLLIVDEEQRFGVAHKERLKKLAMGVDVLAMTATPIPRTLQMSLAGLRDLSVIETPPPGRLAIQTHLVPFRRTLIAQAIRQELRRGGQVFFVHPRVESLPTLAAMLRQLVPEARLVVAHGRMRERQLESVMLRFVRHEADVLVTTTIIENGLDIPRANTILVHRADRFGLAQLYQLRGRVGRSAQRAYAYFIVPPGDRLGDDARRRLRALQEFSDLGAGFRLAAADLEIRGAGELLGTRQHGHIAALGFDLYCQMLERAVRELQGQVVEERRPASLHLGVDIKIPETYIADTGERLVLYKRLASAQEESEIERLEAETEDRYGHLPLPGRNLFQLSRLRLVAERAGVQRVDVADGTIQIRFHDRPPVEPQRIVELLTRRHGSLTPAGTLVLPAPVEAGERVVAVRAVLEEMLGRPAA